LRSRGYDAVAPDLPFDDPTAGYEERALPVITALASIEAPVVIVGHSVGSAEAALVADDCDPALLVYLCPRFGSFGAPADAPPVFRDGFPFPLLRPLTAFFPSCSRRSPRSLTARMRLDLGVEAFQSGDEDVLSEEGGDLDCRLDTVVVARAAEDVDGAKNPGLAHDRRPVSSTATARPDSSGPGEGSPVTF